MTGPSARRRIVLVDDDVEVIDRLRQLLEDDYELIVTTDWGTLNRIFFRDGCDLVLMDVNLPTLQGDRLVRVLQSAAAGRARPAILYHSAVDEETLARLVRETGAEGYVSKSLRPADLLKAIEAQLRR